MKSLIKAGAATLALAGLTQAATAEGAPIDGLPMAILCQKGGMLQLGWLHQVEENGNAIYMTVDGRLAGSFEPEGAFKPFNEMTNADCFGRTLEELRADGRTIEMPG